MWYVEKRQKQLPHWEAWRRVDQDQAPRKKNKNWKSTTSWTFMKFCNASLLIKRDQSLRIWLRDSEALRWLKGTQLEGVPQQVQVACVFALHRLTSLMKTGALTPLSERVSCTVHIIGFLEVVFGNSMAVTNENIRTNPCPVHNSTIFKSHLNVRHV